MQSTLLVHVPKTGGTTLDDLLAEACDPDASLRRVQDSSPISDWERLADPGLTYVSGHVPAGALDLGRYDQRVTVLRAPLELMASRLSYDRRYFGEQPAFPAGVPPDRRSSVYGLYFSPGFDALRYLAERSYGVQGVLGEYADQCTVQEALQILARFDRVIDFRQMGGELKRLTMELGLFPRATMPRLRSYRYEPDLDAARALVSDFDISFYRRAQRQFRPLPNDIDVRYDSYRHEYCRSHGLRLAERASMELPIRGPLGNGWLPPEHSQVGQWFRWANTLEPTLEIPVAEPGDYLLSVYVHPHEVVGLTAELCAEVSGQRLPLQVSAREGVTVLQARAKLAVADWLVLQFRADGPDVADRSGQDLIQLTFVLGRVLLRRGPG